MVTLPLEVVVSGIPISAQSRGNSRPRWIEKVRKAAIASMRHNGEPHLGSVAVHVTYYYEGDRLDVDNILKPILDAMIDVAYRDDSQITDVTGSARTLDGPTVLVGVSEEVLAAFDEGTPFVHILIHEPPDQRSPPWLVH